MPVEAFPTLKVLSMCAGGKPTETPRPDHAKVVTAGAISAARPETHLPVRQTPSAVAIFSMSPSRILRAKTGNPCFSNRERMRR